MVKTCVKICRFASVFVILHHMEKNRLKFIVYLQVIGIILVVFGHSFYEYPDGSHGTELLVYRMMYSFRMPLFMFTSGFLMVFTTALRPRRWSEFAKEKLLRLMVPFVVLTLVTFVPRSLMGAYAEDELELSFSSLLRSFVMGDSLVIPYFWFLQSSFTLLLAVGAVVMIGRNRGWPEAYVYAALMALMLVLNILPFSMPVFFSLNMTAYLGIYFLLGCIYACWDPVVDAHVRWESPWVLAAFVMAWAGLFFVRDFLGFIGLVLCSSAGICMTISLTKMMEARNIKVLDHLSGSNYMIFLLSWYFNVASQQILSHFVALPWWVYTVMSLVCGIYVPWLFYKYINRQPRTFFKRGAAVLLGQKLK